MEVINAESPAFCHIREAQAQFLGQQTTKWAEDYPKMYWNSYTTGKSQTCLHAKKYCGEEKNDQFSAAHMLQCTPEEIICPQELLEGKGPAEGQGLVDVT